MSLDFGDQRTVTWTCGQIDSSEELNEVFDREGAF